MTQRACLPQGVLKHIAKAIGDTSNALKSSEIAGFLSSCGLVDTSPTLTKWKRLYNAFVTKPKQSAML